MFFMAKHVPSDSDLRSANGGRRLGIPKGITKKPKGGFSGGSSGGTTYKINPDFSRHDSHNDSHDTTYVYEYGDSQSE